MTKRVLIFVFAMLVSIQGITQRSSTFENWFSAAAQFKFEDFTLTVEEGWRVREFYMSRQNYTDIGGSYKFNKFFSIAGGYRLALKNHMFNIAEVNHRLYFDVNGSYEVGPVDFSIRSRYQYTSLGQEDDFTLPSETFFRNRFRGKIKINDMFNTSAAYEMLLVMAPGYNLITENRFALDLTCKINKENSISLAYILRNYVQIDEPMNVNVLSLDYVYKF